MCGVDEVKRQRGFNLGPALWTNTAVVAPATTAKHLTKQIANAADGIAVVFHKAIDLTPDPVAAAKTLIKIKGVSHILTSGGAPTAKIGAEILRKMGSASSHLTIIAAGKINQRNFMEIHESLGLAEYHGKLIVGDLHRQNV